jgi:hypothetical protein
VKLTETDLVAIIESHRKDSMGTEDGDLSNQRAEAMDHYHGRLYGNEVEGRSQVVSKDLAEAVDWAMPAILRVFVQSGNLGEFDPVGPDDVQLAQQESDYTNQVMMKDNPGFMVLHDAIKDTLLLKNGYTKHLWETEEKISEESYTGLSMEAAQKLIGDMEYEGAQVEVLGQDSKQVAIGGQMVELFDLKLKVKKKCGKCSWIAVPSEEVKVSKKCRGSLQDSPFTEHETKKTRSELIEMGMARSFVDTLPAYNSDDNDNEVNSRDSVTDESQTQGQSVRDRSMDEIKFCEAYIRVDYDGDGVAELRKVVTVADKIPPGEEWNEPIEAVPMTGWTMKRVPHRHVGESLDDELADLQEIKTALLRSLNDNVYYTNNNEWMANERVNLKDLLTSQPGGIKRIRGSEPIGDSLAPVIKPPILDKILPVLDYWDKVKEVRTGIRPGSDMDPDMLQEVTKGAFLEHLNRASQKIEMITRMIAESGVKESFLQVHGILMRHQDRKRVVQMRGKWVEVDPRQWKERTDLTVRVGLGTGNEEEKRQKLMMLSQLQQALLMAATQAPPPVYGKLYALFEDMSNSMGFETPEKYAIAPNGPEFAQLQQMKQQTPPDPKMIEVQQKMQLEQQRMQMQQQTDANRQEMEAQQQQAKMTMEMELERMKAHMSTELEREKARIKAEVDQIIARMNNAAKLDAAQITAQTTLSTQQEAASDNAAQD